MWWDRSEIEDDMAGVLVPNQHDWEIIGSLPEVDLSSYKCRLCDVEISLHCNEDLPRTECDVAVVQHIQES